VSGTLGLDRHTVTWFGAAETAKSTPSGLTADAECPLLRDVYRKARPRRRLPLRSQAMTLPSLAAV
jgi:hypothetical protein